MKVNHEQGRLTQMVLDNHGRVAYLQLVAPPTDVSTGYYLSTCYQQTEGSNEQTLIGVPQYVWPWGQRSAAYDNHRCYVADSAHAEYRESPYKGSGDNGEDAWLTSWEFWICSPLSSELDLVAYGVNWPDDDRFQQDGIVGLRYFCKTAETTDTNGTTCVTFTFTGVVIVENEGIRNIRGCIDGPNPAINATDENYRFKGTFWGAITPR